jgi:H+-transporting ATPase
VKRGDVVPADAILLPGMSIQADQSALTGESLPTTIDPGGKLKMGSAIKRGESKAVVTKSFRDSMVCKLPSPATNTATSRQISIHHLIQRPRATGNGNIFL